MRLFGWNIARGSAAKTALVPATPTPTPATSPRPDEAAALAMMANAGLALAKKGGDVAGTPKGRAARLTKGLTPEIMATYLDEFYAGRFRNIAMLWDTMQDGDTICAPVAEKRLGKVGAELRNYTVEALDESDAAAKQAKFLRRFFETGIRAEHARRRAEHGGLRKAVEFLCDAIGKKYSFMAKVWEGDGDDLRLTLRHVPLWHFAEQDDGSYRYYPNPDSTLSQAPVREGQWVVGVRRRAVMQAAGIASLLRRLPQQQIARVLERFGVPNVVGSTTSEFNSPGWQAMYGALVAYMSDMPVLLSAGNELKVEESNFRAASLHKTHLEWCTTEIAMNWLGGELGTVSKSGSGTLAGDAQAADLDDLIRDDCDWITEVMNEQIAMDALARRFPKEPVLARFLLRKPDATDDAADMTTIKDAVDIGARVPVRHVHDRFSLPEAAAGEAVLTPANSASATPGATVDPESGGAVQGGKAAATEQVKQVALNGAQVTALLEVIEQVATKRLPREAALEIIMQAFGIEADQAEELMGEVGRGFFVEEDVTTAKANALRCLSRGPMTARANAAAPSRIRDRNPDLDQLVANALPPFGTAYAGLLQPLLEGMDTGAETAEDAAALAAEYSPPAEALDELAHVVAQTVFCGAMMGLEPCRDGIPAAPIGDGAGMASARANAAGVGEYRPLPFDEAREFWEGKVVVSDYADLENMGMTWIESRVLGFQVAAISERVTLERLRDDVGRAIKGETSVGQLTRDLRDKYGLHSAYGETVVRTNVQTAYSWGNWQQLSAPAVVEAFPLLAFDVVDDEDTSDICRPLKNKAYPRDNPVWDGLYPPNHYRCRTTVHPTDAEEAGEDGYTVESSWPRDEVTGEQFMPIHGFEGNCGKVPLRDVLPEKIDKEKEKTAEIIGEGEVADAEERRQLVKGRLKAAGIPLEAEADRIPAGALEAAVPPGFVGDAKAFYRRDEVRVHMGTDPAKWHGLPQTMHHEYGHHLHYETDAVTNQFIDPEFRDAAVNDLAAWETRERGRLGATFDAYYRAQTHRAASVTDHLSRHGIWDGDPENAPLEAYYQAAGYFDVVGGMSKGKMGWGHKVGYYRRLDGAQGLKDVYATCYSALSLGHAELGAEFPETMAYVKRSLGL